MVIGIDEVGRGCWAGPLVAAAVAFPKLSIVGLRDSKKLSIKQRSELNTLIQNSGAFIGIGWVEPEMVDRLGLTESVRLAMRQALGQINWSTDDKIIIDGNINYLNDLPNTRALIKADDSVTEVAAASIVAKVARDSFMAEIAANYPEYGFEKHVGYGTKFHISALKLHGLTPLHRRSFKPVRAYL